MDYQQLKQQVQEQLKKRNEYLDWKKAPELKNKHLKKKWQNKDRTTNEKRLKKRSKRPKHRPHPVDRNDPRVINFKKAVLRRDGYKCVKCGSRHGLHVHHIVPWSCSTRLRVKIKNGITLCENCHGQEHDWMAEHPNMKHLASIKDEIDLYTGYKPTDR